MSVLANLFKDSPSRFMISFTLSFIINTLGVLNEIFNNSIFDFIDKLLGPTASLLMMLIFIPFGLIFTMIGNFIFPSTIWFYVGQLFGLINDTIIIYFFLKFTATFRQKVI